jgi:HSF-type DNA-binding
MNHDGYVHSTTRSLELCMESSQSDKVEESTTDHINSDAVGCNPTDSAHSYTDRSSIHCSHPKPDDSKSEGSSGMMRLASLNPNPNNKDKDLVQFPVRLFHMLERVDQDGCGHVVSWQPHGRCFVVHVPALFEKLLPVYFPGIWKVSSFQRQVCDFQSMLR